MPLKSIERILARCGSENSVLPPTELFNEGWMLRLLLDWLDKNRSPEHELSFAPEARWYSEALLPSRFLPRTRGDDKAESFTHADGVIGHVSVASGARAGARLAPRVGQFVVTEAKLGSSLSAGTKNAPGYDQAARNVACIAHMLERNGLHAASIERLAFFVVAPRTQIKSGIFGSLVTKESIERKVRARVAAYQGLHDAWLDESFLPTLAHIQVATLAWEDVLSSLPSTREVDAMKEFYLQCLRFNPCRVN
jgi:hypothetical protein